MSCCGTDFSDLAGTPSGAPSADEILLASRPLGPDLREIRLSVPSVHCGQCIRTVERGLSALPDVEEARVNLTTKRVAVRWRRETPPPLFETLAGLGYPAFLIEAENEGGDAVLKRLIWALAVAGFAAGNVMMLSMAVWFGAAGEARDLFHWLSALIALPALVFSGRVFFGSAWRALRRGRTNMDVPISLGVLLAFAMSLYDTINHGEHAYFDAAVSLLFFLLIGRTLDHMMREKARNAVAGLARMVPRGVVAIAPDGRRDYLPLQEVEPGMTLLVAAGERIPVDARVEQGTSEVDRSLVTGESMPCAAAPGTTLQSGVLNLSGPLTLKATARAGDSFLAEMIRMMEAAEGGRSAYRRVADRAAALYAPVVHSAALLALAGWWIATGDAHRAITIGIAVLIITCPCALGLAVPMVQVMAARRLFAGGVMVKDGSALERIAEADTVVFDKTGTLTAGAPQLANRGAVKLEALGIAAAIAAHSRHPYSQALAACAKGTGRGITFDHIEEIAGMGLEARAGDSRYRLGRAEWALGEDVSGHDGTVLSRNGRFVAEFRFEDRLREGARQAVVALEEAGLEREIVSGDREAIVARIAGKVGISRHTAGATPAGKIARIEALRGQGRKVLMVGDGLNDAPALAAAHVSIAPASAADIGRSAADFVFLRESLSALPLVLSTARRAGALIRQNFGLAIVYNALAVPFAICGYVTPLTAAIAMSLSSVLVVANSMRLREETAATPAAGNARGPHLRTAEAMR